MTRRGLIGSPERIVCLASSHNPLSGIQSRSLLAPRLHADYKSFFVPYIYIHVAWRAGAHGRKREVGWGTFVNILSIPRLLTSAWETKIFTFQRRRGGGGRPYFQQRLSPVISDLWLDTRRPVFFIVSCADFRWLRRNGKHPTGRKKNSAATRPRTRTTRRAALNFARARLACELNFKRARTAGELQISVFWLPATSFAGNGKKVNWIFCAFPFCASAQSCGGIKCV